MTKNSKSVETQMLIRKPVSEVFSAFIDPEITKNFWFTKGSGKLEIGKTITWEWDMYGITTDILVKEIVDNKIISIEWGQPATTVDFEFKALTDSTTYVTIKNYGFDKTGDELLDVIKDSTGGFTTVLDGLKAFMEHNINLNLIADKFPKEITQYGK
ncbi:SRPBCC family protein [Flavobacterium sp. GT3R68]|uniref:SRPBCC family protein n=1 Tax=Flavobacterium sp. GT3R68 TaxID=2594437 RepID=UPI0018F48780|nr:SRPBCC family protein [Flavobacterium sp. GT3R68]